MSHFSSATRRTLRPPLTSPAGNHFFAYAIKDTVLDWLDPKPITYQNNSDRWIIFEGYLQK